ncbi:hypothetical protein ACIQCF_36230 [Streptomyces sp. NPDC088353]|uniref:hypothetical protein n=1 Tax=Streptomyces sp. NPDC088353 TaxID=3365855 RepID=UPI00382E2B58
MNTVPSAQVIVISSSMMRTLTNRADHRQVGAVGETSQDGGAPVVAETARSFRVGRGHLGEEGVAVEPEVPEERRERRSNMETCRTIFILGPCEPDHPTR